MQNKILKQNYKPSNKQEQDFYKNLDTFINLEDFEETNYKKKKADLSEACFNLNNYLLEDEENTDACVWTFCSIIDALDNAVKKEIATPLVNYLENFLNLFDEDECILQAIQIIIKNNSLKRPEITLFLANRYGTNQKAQ